MKQLPVKTMSESDQRMMREWAQEPGKAVLQLTIRLSQNMTRRTMHQLAEEQEEESGVEHFEMPVTPVNFLSKTIDFLAMNFFAFIILYRLQTKSKESSV